MVLDRAVNKTTLEAVGSRGRVWQDRDLNDSRSTVNGPEASRRGTGFGFRWGHKLGRSNKGSASPVIPVGLGWDPTLECIGSVERSISWYACPMGPANEAKICGLKLSEHLGKPNLVMKSFETKVSPVLANEGFKGLAKDQISVACTSRSADRGMR